MEKYLIPLTQNAIFSGVSVQFIEDKIIPQCQVKRYNAGEQIIGLNDIVMRIGIILTGRIQILELFPNRAKSLLSGKI